MLHEIAHVVTPGAGPARPSSTFSTWSGSASVPLLGALLARLRRRDLVDMGKGPRMILIVLKIQIRPDRRDMWLGRIAKYTAAVHDERGSVSSTATRASSPPRFAVVEGFADKRAGDSHLQTDHFKDFLVWFPTVIGTAPMIINTEVPGEGFTRMNKFG